MPTPSALDDQHRLAIAIAIEAEQAAERSDIRQHAGRERAERASDRDAADRFVAGVDVDAGVAMWSITASASPHASRNAGLGASRALRCCWPTGDLGSSGCRAAFRVRQHPGIGGERRVRPDATRGPDQVARQLARPRRSPWPALPAMPDDLVWYAAALVCRTSTRDCRRTNRHTPL